MPGSENFIFVCSADRLATEHKPGINKISIPGMNQIDPTIFKAYDIRGIYPSKINEEIAYKIGQAYAKFLNPKTVALGRDVRASGPALFEALKNGLLDHGVNVVDIGVITTDMYYFASGAYGYDGASIISASHNPAE